MNRRAAPASIALLTFVTACGWARQDDGDVPPPDVEGTWETASTLTFGACASLRDRDGTVTVVANLDGMCVPYATYHALCRRYSTMEVTVNGVALRRTDDGGWTSAKVLRDDGTAAFGCVFPQFEVPCALPEGDARTCSSPDLFTASGTVDITVSIGGEPRTFTAERWLTKRTISLVSDALVPGTHATIEAGPIDVALRGRLDEENLSFDYDDNDKNRAWCAIEHNSKPWSKGNEYDESGSCDGACCTSWGIGDVDVSTWVGDRFQYAVPERLPAGPGELTFFERRTVTVASCPFGDCVVNVKRSASVRAVVAEVAR